MLRASVERSGASVEVRPIATGSGDTGIPLSREIIEFTDAVVLHDLDEFPAARARFESFAGPDMADRAAMVAGNFSMMNRSLDAIGTPIGRGGLSTASELGIDIASRLLL